VRLDPNQLREAAGRPARQHSEWEWNVLAALGTGSRSIKRVSETGHLREVARIFQHFCGYSGMFTPANSRFLFRNQEAFQLLKDQCEQKFRSMVFIFSLHLWMFYALAVLSFLNRWSTQHCSCLKFKASLCTTKLWRSPRSLWSFTPSSSCSTSSCADGLGI